MPITKATYSTIDGIFLNVNDYGADPTGTIDSTAAIQAAIDAAAIDKQRVVGIGTYKISEKIVIKCNADFLQATFNVYGTPAVAVEISTGSAENPTDILFNTVVWLPKRIDNMTKPTTGWAGQGIGVRTVNLYSCEIFVGNIVGFATGLQMTAYSEGNVYNNIYLGHLQNNKVNLALTPGDSTGYVNENLIIGGRYSQYTTEGINVSGARHILISKASSTVNNNLFVRPSVEGDTPQYHVENGGSYNTIQQARWESSPPKVLYTSDNVNQANDNYIIGGYNADAIVFTYSGVGGSLNRMTGYNLDYVNLGIGQKYTNIGSSADPIHLFYDAGTRVETATSTQWSVKHSAQTLEGKQKTDSYARLKMDYVNGLVAVGNGTGAPTNGATGTFTAGANTITVVGGIITSIV